jgi:uncharacterized membrane protein YphA (DoxX/SURF4 family)
MFQKILSKNLNPQLASLLLRLGLAFVFAYAAINSLLYPNDWVGYLPHGLTIVIGATVALVLISIYQLVLVVWLLTGKKVRYVAILCALTLAGITVANIGVFAITFRDVGLFFAALALVFLEVE